MQWAAMMVLMSSLDAFIGEAHPLTRAFIPSGGKTKGSRYM